MPCLLFGTERGKVVLVLPFSLRIRIAEDAAAERRDLCQIILLGFCPIMTDAAAGEGGRIDGGGMSSSSERLRAR